MTPDPSSPSPDRVPARPRILKLPRTRALALSGAFTVLCLIAAACGGGDGGSTAETQTADTEAASPEAAPSASSLLTTRPGAGIVAAGGTIRGESSCPAPGAAGQPETVRIGYVGPDLDELADIGLETLVFDGPTNIVDAYVNEINLNGGINGHCFEFVAYEWGLVDPVASFGQMCTELPQQEPLVVLSLGLSDTTYDCITLAAELPTFGLFATKTDAQFAAAGGRLFVDQGSAEYLLSTGVETAFMAGALTQEDRAGFLHNEGESAESEHEALESTTEQLGFQVMSEAEVPAEFSELGLLLAESQVRLLQGDLSGDEAQAAERAWAALAPEQAEALRQIEQFFLDAARSFQEAGVTAVVMAADWSDVRRFIRAANLIDWFPSWVLTDYQPVLLVLTDLPEDQGQNLVQASARRAAGDEIPDLDRSCVSMRNTATDAGPFSHRFHTDAWNLITSTCDYLDIIFGAISRVDGPLTHQAFLEALSATDYETVHGSLIKFTAENRFGNDRFRMLKADPNCVLDDWGCMRSLTDWISPNIVSETG